MTAGFWYYFDLFLYLWFMNKNQGHRNVVKERLTILLVFFFCFLISSSEYIIEDSPTGTSQEQTGSQDKEGSPEEQTFFSAAVDAVVPFVFTTVDQALHLIYELVGFEELVYCTGTVLVKHPSYFSEILLERIISPNAP